MLYREIIAVCSEIHTKHINTLYGQNVELLNVKRAVHIVTSVLWKVCPVKPFVAPIQRRSVWYALLLQRKPPQIPTQLRKSQHVCIA